MEVKGKKVLVSGAAKSGISAANLCVKLGAITTLQDLKTEEQLKENLKEVYKEINLYLGKNPDDIIKEQDLLIMSPGVPLELPFVQKAIELNIPVLGELEFASVFCKSPILAITGTNGKTTTTTLVGEILKTVKNTFVVGNIGIPYSEYVFDIKAEDIVVAEVSSFQLETIHTFHPKACAILNFTEDHLNRHKTYENYINIKQKICMNQNEDDFCILNYDDTNCRNTENKIKSKVIFFSTNEKLEEGIYLDDKEIVIKYKNTYEHICNIDDLKILGIHNVQNVMAAVGLCFAIGVSFDVIRKVIIQFKGVEHRIEYVDTIKEIEFFNDSKGTNPDSTIRAIEAMKKQIMLIVGGYDKHSNFTELIQKFNGKVEKIFVIGETADKIIQTAKKENFENYIKCDTFEEAVRKAFESSENKECVLLSPACASWDMFKDYEERGKKFKEIVGKLREEL